MKMKILSFAVAVLLTAVHVNAQKSSVQLRAGINLANISVTSNGRINDAKQLTSFQVGAIGDVHLASIVYLQPGILFTGKGAKTESNGSFGNYKATFNPYYLEVPVNLVFKLPLGSANSFFVGAGPYAAVGVGGKNKVEGTFLGVNGSSEKNIRFSNDDPTTLNTEEGAGFGVVRRFDYGLNGTAGIEGKSIVLGVNYGLGLAKLQSGSNSSQDNNNKNRVLSFTVGLKL